MTALGLGGSSPSKARVLSARLCSCLLIFSKWHNIPHSHSYSPPHTHTTHHTPYTAHHTHHSIPAMTCCGIVGGPPRPQKPTLMYHTPVATRCRCAAHAPTRRLRGQTPGPQNAFLPASPQPTGVAALIPAEWYFRSSPFLRFPPLATLSLLDLPLGLPLPPRGALPLTPSYPPSPQQNLYQGSH